MSLRHKLFGNIPDEPVTSTDLNEPEKITGKIIHLEEDKGWGFIHSHQKKFTRIFFHWTALDKDTLNFTELEKGMIVEFILKQTEDRKWRAIKIKVLENAVRDEEDEGEFEVE